MTSHCRCGHPISAHPGSLAHNPHGYCLNATCMCRGFRPQPAALKEDTIIVPANTDAATMRRLQEQGVNATRER